MWKHRVAGVLEALFLLGVVSGCPVYAADASWNKIRYQGGTIDAKVNPFDWNTTIKIASTEIELVFAGRKRVIIEARNVVALAHGEKACRRVADALAFNSARGPVPLFGMVSMGKDHLVGIEFRNGDGALGAVLLAVHKESYRALLQALRELTGKPVQDAP